MSFEIRTFAEIPKIVGRGNKSSSGRPPLYPFDKLVNVGEGFPFPSTLVKKVRGAVQQYRQNNPTKKFAIRPIEAGQHACILTEILTEEQVREAQERKARARAAEQAAEAQLLSAINGGNSGTQTVRPVESLDDVLNGL